MQTWLGSGVALAVAYTGSYSSDWTPSLGTSICRGSGPRNSNNNTTNNNKRQKDKKKKRWPLKEFPWWLSGNEPN